MSPKKPTPGTTRTWREARKDYFTAEELAENDRDVLTELSLMQMRKELGLTQKEMADRLSVTQGTLSKIENQPSPNLTTIRDYADAMGGRLKVSVRFGRIERPLRLAALESRVKTTTKSSKRRSL